MGLDFVEMIMAIEHEFGVEITDNALLELMRRHDPPDLTPADIASFVCNQPRPALCLNCKYDLQGHADHGRCPECGRAFGTYGVNDVNVRERTRKIIAEIAGIPLEKVDDDSCIRKDLRII